MTLQRNIQIPSLAAISLNITHDQAEAKVGAE